MPMGNDFVVRVKPFGGGGKKRKITQNFKENLLKT